MFSYLVEYLVFDIYTWKMNVLVLAIRRVDFNKFSAVETKLEIIRQARRGAF